MRHQTLVLSGADVRALITLPECIDAVENVFRLHGEGTLPEPGVLGLHLAEGGFHVKAAAAPLGRLYFAAKTNGNFPSNPTRRRLPSIQGVIVLCDGADGRPLAVMDSMEITTLRTAAATGVAARHLAAPGEATVTVVGCGVQGRAQLRALAAVRPLRRVFAHDADERARAAFVREMTAALSIPVTAVDDVGSATRQSGICVTCTPSRRPILGPDDVQAGAFVAAVGADNPEKQEIDPELFRHATVVVDILEQCAAIGDLRHALAAGTVTREDVHAELGQVVSGAVPGRVHDEEVIVFDSTGTALQDVAVAALVYERALEAESGIPVSLSG